jgi:hypothetical protein
MQWRSVDCGHGTIYHCCHSIVDGEYAADVCLADGIVVLDTSRDVAAPHQAALVSDRIRAQTSARPSRRLRLRLLTTCLA